MKHAKQCRSGHAMLCLDIGKNFFSRRVVMHWHRLLRDAVGSPSMEGFENHGDVALGDVISGHGGMGWGSWRSFPTRMIL